MNEKFKYIIFSALFGLFLSFALPNLRANRIYGEMDNTGQSKDQPNLLFIMTDQQRFDAMSCAGNEVLETPNMDRIAREGVMFKNTYTANPVCVPARAVFLTGLSCVNARVESNGDYTSKEVPDVPTFDRILKENGYAAEYYGKWHTPYQFADCYDNDVKVVGNIEGAPGLIKAYQAWLVSKGVTRKEPGEDELFSGRNQRPYKPVELDYNYDKAVLDTDEKMKLNAKQSTQYGRVELPPRISYAAFTAEETLEALERLKDGPFTLTCSFDPPHPPMIVQDPYYSMYSPEIIPAPESITDPMEDSPYRERANQTDQMRYRDAEQIRHMRSIYYGMVREIDDWIGEILTKLDELGLAENTLVIFTSDHGEMLGDHGMHSKTIFYEGSVHVPLLIRFPGRIKPGTIVESPVSTMDISPTILDYLGMPIPSCDGISLRTFVEGKPLDHDVVSFSRGNSTPNYMIRSGDLKMMIAENEKNQSVDALYDLNSDPNEMRNLIISPVSHSKNREQADKMKERLVKWMEIHEPNKANDLRQRELYR
ncbi:sulfatase-like hydrolase/transferase [Bacteroidota bacterium]